MPTVNFDDTKPASVTQISSIEIRHQLRVMKYGQGYVESVLEVVTAIGTDGICRPKLKPGGGLAWDPGSGPDAADRGLYSSAAPVAPVREDQVATAGQTLFTLTTITYTPGNNGLFVYRNGLLQRKGAGSDYLETSTTEVTFNAGLVAGDRVTFLKLI